MSTERFPVEIDPWGLVVVVDAKSSLLLEGPCGLRPPVARYSELVSEWRPYEGSIENAECPLGLVVWWERKPVMMAIDRVARALQCHPFRDDRLESRDLKIWLVSLLRDDLVGKVVLLDEGRHVALELARDPQNPREVIATRPSKAGLKTSSSTSPLPPKKKRGQR